jgi:hypothetical protein
VSFAGGCFFKIRFLCFEIWSPCMYFYNRTRNNFSGILITLLKEIWQNNRHKKTHLCVCVVCTCTHYFFLTHTQVLSPFKLLYTLIVVYIRNTFCNNVADREKTVISVRYRHKNLHSPNIRLIITISSKGMWERNHIHFWIGLNLFFHKLLLIQMYTLLITEIRS